MSEIASATHPPALGPKINTDPGTPDGEKQEHILIWSSVLISQGPPLITTTIACNYMQYHAVSSYHAVPYLVA